MLRRARLLAFGLATVILVSSLPAFCDEAQVTVVTKSGAKYRGELVEEVPNDHVTIKLATGEVKRFAWGELEREGASGPLVVLDAAQPLVLERPRGAGFETVCLAPCNVRVAPGDYRLSGAELRATRTFGLAGTGTTKIEADLGSARAHTVGTIVGVAGLGVATWSLIVGTTLESDKDALREGLFVAAGVGAAVSIAGFIIAAANSNSVTVDGRTVASRRASPAIALTSRGLVF